MIILGKRLEKNCMACFIHYLCLVIQSCLTLCNPTDCSPAGSSAHGILQTRILEWVAIPFSNSLFQYCFTCIWIPARLRGKESTCTTGDAGSIPGLGRSLEEGEAIHSSILVWRIPWVEEPGGLQSIGLQRVGHD